MYIYIYIMSRGRGRPFSLVDMIKKEKLIINMTTLHHLFDRFKVVDRFAQGRHILIYMYPN